MSTNSSGQLINHVNKQLRSNCSNNERETCQQMKSANIAKKRGWSIDFFRWTNITIFGAAFAEIQLRKVDTPHQLLERNVFHDKLHWVAADCVVCRKKRVPVSDLMQRARIFVHWLEKVNTHKKSGKHEILPHFQTKISYKKIPLTVYQDGNWADPNKQLMLSAVCWHHTRLTQLFVYISCLQLLIESVSAVCWHDL